jgi:hypothetical protein
MQLLTRVPSRLPLRYAQYKVVCRAMASPSKSGSDVLAVYVTVPSRDEGARPHARLCLQPSASPTSLGVWTVGYTSFRPFSMLGTQMCDVESKAAM